MQVYEHKSLDDYVQLNVLQCMQNVTLSVLLLFWASACNRMCPYYGLYLVCIRQFGTPYAIFLVGRFSPSLLG